MFPFKEETSEVLNNYERVNDFYICQNNTSI